MTEAAFSHLLTATYTDGSRPMPSSGNQAGRTELKLKAVREAAFTHLLTATLQHNEQRRCPKQTSKGGYAERCSQIRVTQHRAHARRATDPRRSCVPDTRRAWGAQWTHKAGDSPNHRLNRGNVDNTTTGRASYVPIVQRPRSRMWKEWEPRNRFACE